MRFCTALVQVSWFTQICCRSTPISMYWPRGIKPPKRHRQDTLPILYDCEICDRSCYFHSSNIPAVPSCPALYCVYTWQSRDLFQLLLERQKLLGGRHFGADKTPKRTMLLMTNSLNLYTCQCVYRWMKGKQLDSKKIARNMMARRSGVIRCCNSSR